MILEIADDPDAAMDEEQHAWLAAHLLGLHDVEYHPRRGRGGDRRFRSLGSDRPEMLAQYGALDL